MASTYFHGGNSEIQSSADGLQTLYLMNPTYVPYSDTSNHPATPNMFLLNPNNTPHAGHALNLPNLPHAPPPSHHNHTLLGLIPPNILGSDNQPDITAFHGLPATNPRVNHNLWGSIIDHQTPSSPAAATPSSSSGGAAASGFRRPSQQGLSLSLSSQQTAYNRSLSGELEIPGQPRVAGVSPTSQGRDDMQILGSSPSSMASNGVSSMQSSVILGSKYLKAAQELLDEVVSVGKGNQKGETIEKMKGNRSESECGGNNNNYNNMDDGGSSGGGNNKQAADLSTAQRQELQMKKSKLVNMLDEVEQRYRQYRHQMQMVISSFEQVAGYGAAKSYTALALKTISKQFRCLKDAISSQIKATSKTLGEEDCLGAKVEGCRLRYVDHHLRQQRALQQLGMMHHNAWRPQRGLPERAVSILRAWLFEHFLHPYPKDSDKVMLAKQTGLTRSQVSNWFINARVRLWKPMVEEMYLEETKEQEQKNGSSNSKDNTNRSSKESTSKEANNAASLEESPGPINIRSLDDQIKALQSKTDQTFNFNINQTTISLPEISDSPTGVSSVPHSSNHLSVDVEMKPRDIKDAYSNQLISGGGGYVGFSMQDIGRFNVNNVSSDQQLAPRFHGNGVSLTLGLPHNDNLPLSATQHHGFLSHNMHLETNSNGSEYCAINTSPHPPPPSSHSGTTTTYENIEMQNRKSFAAQLLPDFVT